ncbi:MAG: hypothetical protein ABIT09_12640 [Croceibacterium sp.]
MSALDHLHALARGDAPAHDGLLANTRCAWGRGAIVGEEAILAAFCQRPFAFDGALGLECQQSAALVGDEDALIADVYDGRIGRLWRVGRGVILPAESAVDVAFDADLRQQRGTVDFRAEDHPQLDRAGAERLLTAARSHVDDVRRAGMLRVRAFVLRAFSASEGCAALLAVFSLSNETSRSASFSYAIVGIAGSGDTVRLISEESPPSIWKPRL